MAKSKRKNKEKNEMDKTQKYKIKKISKHPKAKKIIKISLISLLIIILITAGVVFGMLYGIIRDAKLGVEDLVIKRQNSTVKDLDGNTIAILSGDENRESISIEEMPEYLPQAFIAIEDERFNEHMGIDIKRTLAATVTYVLHAGKSSFGGSTITQQLVKNLTEEKDRTWKRKVKEMARAYYIEQELSKDQILELYLNLIFMGGKAYGVEIASNYYFSKSATELDLAECAFLAGINNTPNSYNPFLEDETEKNQNLEEIKVRTKTVLNKMKQLGKIKTDEEYNQAVAEVDAGLKFTKGTISENVYSYHTDAAIMQIINQLKEENDWNYETAKYYLYNSGFTVYSTQNTTIQNIMNEESKLEKYRNTRDGEASQASMTLIDHKTGYVLGVIGGLGAEKSALGLNRATQAMKQTGSAMKPLAVLVPGINEQIITAGTVLDDVPHLGFKDYGAFKGLLTIRYSIESSQNIPMVKAMQLITTQKSIEYLKNLGLTNLVEADNNLGLALGGLTQGTNTMQMAAAYGTIANNGVYITPTFYTKVVDSDGNIVLEPKQETRTVLSPQAAYIIKEMLTQPVKSGTASYCGISGMSVAAKTGTTNDDYDRWMCGFTEYYSAATWYGYDNNRTVTGWSGKNPSGLIFSSVMKQANSGLEGKYFSSSRPDGVVTATICRDSGMLATEACQNDPRGSRTYTEYFIKGSAPTKTCECHVSVNICTDTGLLANEFCPHKETKVFITRPDSETNTGWKRANDAQYMLTIKDTCTTHTKAADTTKPEIKINGSNNITVLLNATYTDAGATAIDDTDGNITSKIVTTGKVDTTKEGTYTIKYSVKDTSGNEATTTRTVNVKKQSSNDDITNSTNTTVPTNTSSDNQVANTTI